MKKYFFILGVTENESDPGLDQDLLVRGMDHPDPNPHQTITDPQHLY
jgi:hypothetical protein